MRTVCIAIFVLQVLPARGESLDAAREHYARGNMSFEVGDYDTAVEEFQQAYAISHKPKLLFNLAQAYRFNKDHEKAIEAYQRYLELEPNAPNRDDVETF